MTVTSMTGFARSEGHDEGYDWTWEARSVNARNLDLRCRLPPGLDRLEPEVRRMVSARFRRGSIHVGLQLRRASGQVPLRINRALLAQVMAVADELRTEAGTAPPGVDGLLALPGMLEPVEEDEAAVESRTAGILRSLGDALEALTRARSEEGARLAPVVDALLREMAELTEAAAACAAAQPEALRERLERQVAELLAAAPGLPEERLAQEAAVLATKADVREEIERLRAHVAAARDLTEAEEAVGRRLEFLCQEFNREANTLCAKAQDLELTRIGLALKAAIDRLREQVQNVE